MKQCEEMIRDVHRRIEAYKAEKKRRRRKAVKLTTAGLPVIALAAAAGLRYGGRLFSAPALYSGDASADIEILAETDSVLPEESQTEITRMPDIAVSTEDSSAEHDVFLQTGDAPSQSIRLIRSYPAPGEYCYAAPANGQCACTVPLRQAMEEYGDSAHYLLVLHLFADQSQMNDIAALTAESERLYQLGYTPAIETVVTQEETVQILTLNATYDQIENFPAEDDRSYFLLLRDEIG